MTRGDERARKRIATDLNTSLLVEASAGSGKTTALVERMISLVADGVPVESIAAVTFTRRAADELRERFQNRLETAFRDAVDRAKDASRFETALRDLPRAFLGTIHAFCGRLLRERPIEIGLDPRFDEVAEAEWEEYKESFWNEWLEYVSIGDDASVAGLHAVGIEPRWLAEAFMKYVEYGDVRFDVIETPAPEIDDCRRQLNALVDRAWRLMPKTEPADGWDKLMELVWKLRANRTATDGWRHRIDFCNAISKISESACGVTLKRWGDDTATKEAAKELSIAFKDWFAAEGEPTIRQWREHRYPAVIGFLDRAAKAFERQRRSAGRLGFTDLLMLSAKLLREHPEARAELGRRYSRLLVDEFQDTDPIQAEVCLLLSSDPSEGNDWRTVVARPGGLFVVGDPKQSIYRFRRADIETYNLVRDRFESFGDVLKLDTNFRSTKPIETFVNAHFSNALQASAQQAPFSPMVTEKKAGRKDAVRQYTIVTDERSNQAMFDLDAVLLATWIRERIDCGERKAADFMILTQTRAPLETYARALGEREIAVDVGGAELLKEYELTELLVVLRVLADPDNSVAVAAALEGLFFGLSPADLFEARQLGHTFSITRKPSETESAAGRGLATLHEWWAMSRRQPADVVVDRVLDETGLLAFAAGEPIGESRAGVLLRLVDELRAVSGYAGLTMSGAIAHIEALLRQESDDTPLRSGRTDAVRLMNVHRAKGLEADVVVLAAPSNLREFDPDLHVSRTANNEAQGWMQVANSTSAYGGEILAQPPGWEKLCETERQFEQAEDVRLLYVASTRAKHELVVARAIQKNKLDESRWSKLSEALAEHSKSLELTAGTAAKRNEPTRTRDDVLAEIAAAASRVDDASRPTTRATTVTRSVKSEAVDSQHNVPLDTGLGAAWGRAVHRSIEMMGRGVSGDDLTACVEAIAKHEDVDATRVLEVLARVRSLPDWPRLSAFEVPVMQVSTEPDGTEVVTEGVIDAVAHDEAGWTVIDWKTDAVDDAVWAERANIYEAQVGEYERILGSLTGETSRSRIERLH
jgi:ATP-dependent helicase/nuclease subunit A